MKRLFINLYCGLIANKTQRQKIRRVLLNQDRTEFLEQQNAELLNSVQSLENEKQNLLNQILQYEKSNKDLIAKLDEIQNQNIILNNNLNQQYARNIFLQNQVDFFKEHCDVNTCKPATGDLRKYQLDIVKFAADFFKEIEELGIKPFLISGNLLGYVRHNGFVPWDDDLDFGLMRDDYEKLIKYCREHYVVCGWPGRLSEYTNAYTRLYDRCTKYPNQYVLDIWWSQLQLSFGSSLENQKFIDFWVFDYFDDNYTFDKHKKYLADIFAKTKEIDYVDKITQFVRKEALNNSYIVKKSNKIYFGIDCVMSYTKKNDTFIDNDIMFPLKTAEFEGQKFYIPNKPEKYLPFEFKDWSTWPNDIGYSHHDAARNEFLKELQEKNNK